tara:strand:- start:242 stop:1819 length:1578 start_codon:yes stop_codon:yes gene_type:complete
MYDPKFTQKEMYDQYGRSRPSNKKVDPKPSRGSGFSGMGPDPAEKFGGSPTKGLGSKPFERGSTYDVIPTFPKDDKPEPPTRFVDTVKNKAVELFKFFGGDDPKDTEVDPSKVYRGPMFRGPINPGVIEARIRDAVDYSKAPPLFYSGIPNEGNMRYDVVPPASANKNLMKNSINSLLQRVAPNSKEYTIKRGDTLSQIAEKEGVSVADLAKVNKLDNVDLIIEGETIVIPKPQEMERAKDFVDSIDPDAQFSQSGVPMDQRIFEPELGYDEITLPSEATVDKKIKGLGARPEVTVTELDAPLIDTSPRTQGELLDTDGVNSIDFNDELLDELVDLEGRGGDFLSSTPTYDLGITESKANEYNLDPDDYTTFGDFAKDFTKQYVDEKYLENKDIFKTVDKENHTALMSYLWNVGSFGTNQTTALEDNDMREFVAEMKDAIGSEGFSSSGLSARRAKEANMIGENLDDWNPIVKVVITGTRANPTFTWEDADGNTVEEYTTTRSLHPQNVKNKPNANDVLNEEINL